MKFVVYIDDELLEWARKEYDLIDSDCVAARTLLDHPDCWTRGNEIKILRTLTRGE